MSRQDRHEGEIGIVIAFLKTHISEYLHIYKAFHATGAPKRIFVDAATNA